MKMIEVLSAAAAHATWALDELFARPSETIAYPCCSYVSFLNFVVLFPGKLVFELRIVPFSITLVVVERMHSVLPDSKFAYLSKFSHLLLQFCFR